MIAVDTSAFVAFFSKETDPVSIIVEEALAKKHVVLPPVVLTELLSEPNLPSVVIESLKALPLIQPTFGYWERAGMMRAKILRMGHKAKIADALIAQSCIDDNIFLVSKDKDFRHFQKHFGLKLKA